MFIFWALGILFYFKYFLYIVCSNVTVKLTLIIPRVNFVQKSATYEIWKIIQGNKIDESVKKTKKLDFRVKLNIFFQYVLRLII